jgi:hypothetical protein
MTIFKRSVDFFTQPSETAASAWTKIGSFWGLFLTSGDLMEVLQLIALLLGIAFTASQLYILWADRSKRK